MTTTTESTDQEVQIEKPRPVSSRRGLWIGIGLLLGVLIGWVAVYRPALLEAWRISAVEEDDFNAFAGVETAPRVGAAAPDFSLLNLEGETVTLSEQRGRTVLINFWATWCGPCRIEMPAIQAQYDKHSPDLVVLAVDFDEPQDLVQAFVDELGLTFPVLLDPGGQVNQKLYQVRGYPSSFFVDSQGIIQIVHIGLMTEGQLEGYLEEMGIR